MFEDKFMEVQIRLIQMTFDLLPEKVDRVYIHGSLEENSKSFNTFLVKDNMVKTLNTFDIPIEARKEFLQVGTRVLMELEKICKDYYKPIPTELKLIYNVEEESLKSNYQYEPVATLETAISSGEVFMSWIKEIKKQL